VSQSGAENTPTPLTTLMTIVMYGSGTAMPLLPAMPPRPSFQNDIPANATNAPERALNFNTAGQGSGASQHTIAIDGGPQEKFMDGPPLTIAKLGTIEQWKISNTTNGGIDHPFHIHINPFQVVEVFDPNAPMQDANGHTIFHTIIKDGAPTLVSTPLYVFNGQCVANKNGNGPHPVAPCWTATDQCLLDGNVAESWHPCPAMPSPYNRGTNIWWDVFPIPDGITNPAANPPAGVPKVIAGYFKMRTKFVDYNGSFVLHCHILAHEDRGMMLQVNLALAPGMPMMQHH
jgi:FtsP/CotA-like multicopper oxidase with cupredoxin domain